MKCFAAGCGQCKTSLCKKEVCLEIVHEIVVSNVTRQTLKNKFKETLENFFSLKPHLNSFLVSVPILYSQKTPENIFFLVFSGGVI